MPVRDDERLDLVPPLSKKAGVGKDFLHPVVGEAAEGENKGVSGSTGKEGGGGERALCTHSGNMSPASMRM